VGVNYPEPEPDRANVDLKGTIEAMRTWLATDPRDWSRDRTDARLWAVLHGWDGEEDGDEAAWPEVALRHGWDERYVEALKARARAIQQVLDA
jgi:hypothetical protein